MKTKKLALVSAIAMAMAASSVYAEDFDDIADEAFSYGDEIRVLVGAAQDEKIDGSINISAEQINIGGDVSGATATATSTVTDAAAQATASVYGNALSTLVVGAMNTAEINAVVTNVSAFDYVGVDGIEYLDTPFGEEIAEASYGDYLDPSSGLSGGFAGLTAELDDVAIVSLANSDGELDASINIVAALEQRDAGWFLSPNSIPVATVDLANVNVSTTVIGAMNNTVVNLTNTLDVVR